MPPISTALVTNEVKNSSATEVEFQSVENTGKMRVYAKIGEQPALETRLTVKHQEVGSGIKRKRESVAIITLNVVSDVDPALIVPVQAHVKLVHPIGALLTSTPAKDALAMVGTFVFTTDGATFNHAGGGTGASALLSGGIG